MGFIYSRHSIEIGDATSITRISAHPSCILFVETDHWVFSTPNPQLNSNRPIDDTAMSSTYTPNKMAAFVTPSAAPVASSASQFVSGAALSQHKSNVLSANAPSVAPSRSPVSMNVLSGLDTVNQDSYSYSRYILGPFQPLALSPNSTEDERNVAMLATYRHVFGNAYLMEEEKADLAIPESQFKMGNISAKEFVRALAKSSAYKTRFLEGCSQYRFIELNFMHLLGRAPDSREEMSEHHNRSLAEGADVDIDSYIDSKEYASVFGDDTIPFLRFRGAYTPCDSFNKQCALKGGWANSDKAMGGAAITGYNGSDGRNLCPRISSYITGEPTPYEEVADNTPLRTTAPNWVAFPNPAIPPTPAYVTVEEVNEAQALVTTLQAQYDEEIAKRGGSGEYQLSPFRKMVDEMQPVLERGYAYSDPLLSNPSANLISYASPLVNSGGRGSDYKRFALQIENDTISRLERDLEEAKAELRVLQKALAETTPMTPSVILPSTTNEPVIAAQTTAGDSRPRIKISARSAPVMQQPPVTEGKKLQVAGISVPVPSLPSLSVPSLPSLPNPFKKE